MYRTIYAANAPLAALILMMSGPLVADEPSIVDAFNRANAPPAQSTNLVSFALDGCRFQKSLTNIGYCAKFGKGEGNRVITTVIDLTEVETIKTEWYRGKFSMAFELDFGAPGAASLTRDILMTGKDGSFERHSERREKAFVAADLKSGKTFSNCGGAPDNHRKKRDFTLFNDIEPEGWKRLVLLAKQCRAPKTMTLIEK